MKLFIIVIFISFFGLLLADQWQSYKKRFGKKFTNLKEEKDRLDFRTILLSIESKMFKFKF